MQILPADVKYRRARARAVKHTGLSNVLTCHYENRFCRPPSGPACPWQSVPPNMLRGIYQCFLKTSQKSVLKRPIGIKFQPNVIRRVEFHKRSEIFSELFTRCWLNSNTTLLFISPTSRLIFRVTKDKPAPQALPDIPDWEGLQETQERTGPRG